MRMRFELFIAVRYLRAKRRQAVIGVVTAISAVGVAAGGGVADYCAGDYEWDEAGPGGAAAGVDRACGPDAGSGGWDEGLAAAAGAAAEVAACDGGGSGDVWAGVDLAGCSEWGRVDQGG